MSLEGDTADKFVHEGIEITEHAIKLAGLGAKNLAALLLALLKDNQKLKGKTNINRLLRTDKPMSIFTIKREDLAEFRKRAKHDGVLYAAATHLKSKGKMVDVFVWDERAAWCNKTIEEMGYPAPTRGEGKNAPARAQPDGKSNGRGFGFLQQAVERMNNPVKKNMGKAGALENLPAEVLAALVLKIAGENREHREAGPLAQLFTAEKGLQQTEIPASMVPALQKQADALNIPVHFAEGSTPDKAVMVARTEDAAVINRLCENMGEKPPMQVQAPEQARQQPPAQEQKRGPGRPPKAAQAQGDKPSVRQAVNDKKLQSKKNIVPDGTPQKKAKAPKPKAPAR